MPYFIVGSLLSAIIMVAGWMTCFYNRMTDIKMRVDKSRANLYMEYEANNDLIQALAEIVFKTNQAQEIKPKAAASTSRYFADTLLTNITHSFWEQNIRLKTLLKLSELCPEIQMDEDFVQIQQELQELEQRTQLYRQSHIEAVLVYNRFLSAFPNNIAANILGIKELPHSLPDNNPTPVSG